MAYFGSMGEKAANVGRRISNEPNRPSSGALGINHMPCQGHSVVLVAFWRPLQGEFYPLPVVTEPPCIGKNRAKPQMSMKIPPIDASRRFEPSGLSQTPKSIYLANEYRWALFTKSYL